MVMVKYLDGFKGLRDTLIDLKREFRYNGSIEIGKSGFHFCLNIKDVFKYCLPTGTIFVKVRATGNIINEENNYVTDNLSITELLEGKYTSGDNIFHFKNGLLHNVTEPALVLNGATYWCIDGKYDRQSSPAVIDEIGNEYWYKNGVLQSYRADVLSSLP